MRDGAHFVQGLFEPVDPAEPCEPRQPSNDDVWQAASLLIGVHGRDAVEYAVQRINHLDDRGDRMGVTTWALILTQIEDLLRGSPPSRMN